MADYEIPAGIHYTTDDEWVRREGDRITVGITDYAQQQLGDIVFVELPEVGHTVEKGEPFGVIESVKAVADLVAPVTGEVIEVNPELSDHPDYVNDECYGDGWMIAIAAEIPGEYDGLLDADAYRKHIDDRSED